MFSLADIFPHCAPTHYDEILLQHFHLWFIICPWVILLKSSGLCLSLCIRVLQILLSEILKTKVVFKYFSESRNWLANISKISQILGCSFPLIRREEKGECLYQIPFQKMGRQLSFFFWWCIFVRYCHDDYFQVYIPMQNKSILMQLHYCP